MTPHPSTATWWALGAVLLPWMACAGLEVWSCEAGRCTPFDRFMIGVLCVTAIGTVAFFVRFDMRGMFPPIYPARVTRAEDAAARMEALKFLDRLAGLDTGQMELAGRQWSTLRRTFLGKVMIRQRSDKPLLFLMTHDSFQKLMAKAHALGPERADAEAAIKAALWAVRMRPWIGPAHFAMMHGALASVLPGEDFSTSEHGIV